MFSVAILAGGLAKRLYPITSSKPKALVEVAGKPFITRQLYLLQEQGITDVVICVGHLGELIKYEVEKDKNLKLNVVFSMDGVSLLGTGGALRNAINLLGENFFVLYGDSYLPINFSLVEEAYKKSGKSALMTVIENKNQWDRSNVLFKHETLVEYNKHEPREEMCHIDYGLGVLSRTVFNQYSLNETFDLSRVYHQLSLKGDLAGFEVFQRFYEIGSHSGLADTEAYFLQKRK